MKANQVFGGPAFAAGQFPHLDFAGPAAGRGVHENHRPALAEILGNFGRELMKPLNPDWREFFFQQIGGAPSQAIIPTQRISESHDQYLRLRAEQVCF